MEKEKLFERYPYLENDEIILRKMTAEDAEALGAFARNERVYKYLPTFLYEQKYEDPREVIERMDEECFRTGESILLAVCLKEEPLRLAGIAEIYNYEEKKEKASIGCRLDDSVWGRGIGTQVIGLLTSYLTATVGLRTVTAHILHENAASAKAAEKCGFVNKYPGIYGDWGFGQLMRTDKYVFKSEWEQSASKLLPVRVEQFVMAYGAEQDRIRAMLPDGYMSLRPVLRINAEIRDERVVYLEFNTPVEADGRRGWLNIDFWKNSLGDDIRFDRSGKTVTFTSPFLTLTFKGTGIQGGCPAEKDNEGCYYLGADTEFRPAEKIDGNREFCDCAFAWCFHEGDAAGASEGRTIPAFAQEEKTRYERKILSAENAAAIPCEKVLGAYVVRFERYADGA